MEQARMKRGNKDVCVNGPAKKPKVEPVSPNQPPVMVGGVRIKQEPGVQVPNGDHQPVATSAVVKREPGVGTATVIKKEPGVEGQGSGVPVIPKEQVPVSDSDYQTCGPSTSSGCSTSDSGRPPTQFSRRGKALHSCPECHATFCTPNEMVDHRVSVHSPDAVSEVATIVGACYKCTYCDRLFMRKIGCQNHVLEAGEPHTEPHSSYAARVFHGPLPQPDGSEPSEVQEYFTYGAKFKHQYLKQLKKLNSISRKKLTKVTYPERRELPSERDTVLLFDRTALLNERQALNNFRAALMNERLQLQNERVALKNTRRALLNERLAKRQTM